MTDFPTPVSPVKKHGFCYITNCSRQYECLTVSRV